MMQTGRAYLVDMKQAQRPNLKNVMRDWINNRKRKPPPKQVFLAFDANGKIRQLQGGNRRVIKGKTETVLIRFGRAALPKVIFD